MWKCEQVGIESKRLEIPYLIICSNLSENALHFAAINRKSLGEKAGDSYIKLHVLMNDLAQSVSEGLCLILELDDGMRSLL